MKYKNLDSVIGLPSKKIEKKKIDLITKILLSIDTF